MSCLLGTKKMLPPYLSYTIGEVSGIQKQRNENWKIEPCKSIPLPEKETNPEEIRKRKKMYII